MGSNPSKITSQDNAILHMKLQRDKLRQYQVKIQTVLDLEKQIARQCLAQGDKKRALLALRKRKYQEQLLIKTDSQLETLEQLTSNIEFALVQKDVLYGLQQGNQVLKEINQEMSIEKVEKIMDDSAEGIAYQREISDMLANSITNAEELEIQQELEAMESEELAKKIPDLQVPDHIPETVIETEHHVGEEEEELQEQDRTKMEPILA